MIMKLTYKVNVHLAYCMRMIRFYNEQIRLAANDPYLAEQARAEKYRFIKMRNQFLKKEKNENPTSD